MEFEAHADDLLAAAAKMPLSARRDASGSSASAATDEQRLIERARRDPAAFATLYRRYYGLVARYVYRRTGDEHATEDLVAETFMTALRRLSGFRWRGVPVRYWLYRIATNRVGHWSRRRRRELLRDAAHAAVRAHEQAQRIESSRSGDSAAELARIGGVGDNRTDAHAVDIEHMQQALLKLPPRYQAVLTLHYLEGLSVEETAAALGCRGGTVKSRLSRARDALRAVLVLHQQRSDGGRSEPATRVVGWNEKRPTR